MELEEWLGKVFGSTLPQEAFYKEVFRNILETGSVYPSEIKGWAPRSKRYWLRRLCDLGVLRKTREGFQGRWVYRVSNKFLAYLEDLYFQLKKVIR